MSSLQQLLDATLVRLRRADTDLQDVEVKDASSGTPGALPDLVSAFATGTGGLLLLGPSEARGFEPTAIDAPALSRNATLAKLLEAVQDPTDRRVIAENRGTGLVVAAALLRRIGTSPPELVDRVYRPTATLPNDGLLDGDALRWLEGVDTRSLNERQRLALAFARRQGAIDNRRYRAVTGCDAATATRELAGLAASGLVEKRGERRGTRGRSSARRRFERVAGIGGGCGREAEARQAAGDCSRRTRPTHPRGCRATRRSAS